MQQARWGAGGDHQIIAIYPWSVQEMYDLTIEAFNLSEKLRVPVVILTDELVAHLRENAKFKPEPSTIDRNKRTGKPAFGTKDDTGIPPMPPLGSKQKLLITGTTHDEEGYRKDSDPEAAAALAARLSNKILSRKEEIIKFEKDSLDDADIVIISYGFTARSASRAVKLARQKGIKLGLLRLVTIWPFPDELTGSLKNKKIIVAEMNKGQIAAEVQRCTGTPPQLISRTDGLPIQPDEILEFIQGVSK
jgi:2-oxoglutarate ferredoxin oxidoreductase subunit alpha